MPFITKGKTNVKYLAIILVLAVLAGTGIFRYRQDMKEGISSQNICTQETKICPDGSSVFRAGPACDFSACPVNGADGPSGGQIYQNEEYGFEIEYPLDFEKQETGSGTSLLTIKKTDDRGHYYFGISVIKNHKVDSILSKVEEVKEVSIGGRPGYEYFYVEGAGMSEVLLIQAGKDALSISLDHIGSGKSFETENERKDHIQNLFSLIVSSFNFVN